MSSINKNSEEYKAAFDLETWKRAEQAKFKNHLKQIELETIENVTKEWKTKEEKRDAELQAKGTQVDTLIKNLRVKTKQLQTRESRIVQIEDELKAKLNESSRQLGVKEEEIIDLKRKFKEERMGLQNNIKGLQAQLEDSKGLLDEVEMRYRNYRQDMEESPLSVLRTEIGNKNIEVAELKAKLDKVNGDKIDLEMKFKKLRQEYTKLRRETERQKDEMMEKQAEELEKVKMELKNKALDEQQRQEILLLKDELTKLQTKVLISEEDAKQAQQTYISNPMSSNYDTTNTQLAMGSNPFATSIQPATIGRNIGSPDRQQKPNSKLEELQQLKENLMSSQMYSENDDIIIELENQIKRETKVRSPQK